ncbi:hypothetical protein IEQ44_05565 [Nocardioides sp. Y6]|uniref:Lipoprotein n=1 Tax=Nocardioides malaquae TaxID=2773426 RepID=A0ABR9RRB5_9ACTN|nr:hypothetical protein [Nocardioides malaquae]MBE7324113.1 hypothetical protein [Nocardioides malaquae]
MSRSSTRLSSASRWACGVVAAIVLAGCSSEDLAVPGDLESPESSASESVSPSESPTESPSGSPSEEPSTSTTDVGCESEGKGRPGPMPDRPSVVELGRLSGGEPDRLAAENFALSVAHLFIDARDPRLQASVIDAVASPRLGDEARDRFLDAYEDNASLEEPRRFTVDAQVWLRSCIVGPTPRPREVRVEVAGVVADPALGDSFLTTLRIDVVRRDDRWEVLDLLGPEMRTPVDPEVQGLKPLLEGNHWRQVVSEPVEAPEPEESEAPDESASPGESGSPSPASTSEDATPAGR